MIVICASEVGTIPIPHDTIIQKGRLQPGKMLLIDTEEGRIVDDAELKGTISKGQDFGKWISDHMISMSDVKEWQKKNGSYLKPVLDSSSVSQDRRMLAFAFTLEQLNMLITPMVIFVKILGERWQRRTWFDGF